MNEKEREFLADTNGILVGYDGCNTVESLKNLIDETFERNKAMLNGEIEKYEQGCDWLDFAEIRREKNRGMSNNEFFDNSKIDLIESKCIVITALSNDGNITTYRTTESQLECLGMMEVAKNQLLNDMSN